MAAPAWIWSDAHGSDRNTVALFRAAFSLPQAPERAELHLFADTCYRLRIGGAVVCYGPGRFAPTHPEYDTVDLAPWLGAGENVITVEAWSPNAHSFHSTRESRGGFIAWGAVEAAGTQIDLATPGRWLARAGAAWDAEAPSYSSQQPPVEIVDLRQLPEAWFTAGDSAGWVKPTPRVGGPWGPLTARQTPPFSHRVGRPARLPLVAALAGDELRVSCRRTVRDLAARRQQAKGARFRFPYAVVLRSPRDQEIELGLFWGPHWLNGAELAMANDALRITRQNTRATLRAGDNLLYGEPEVLADVWGHYVAVPRASGVELGVLRYGPVLTEAELSGKRGAVPAAPGDVQRLQLAWDEAQPSPIGPLPARDVAWSRPGRVIARDAAANFPMRFDAGADPSGWAIVADFVQQFGGHVLIDLEAPEGTVIDVGIDERLRADGLEHIGVTNYFIESAERAVHSGGRRTIELFHARGGRYAQVCIRPPAGGGQVVVHGIGVRDHWVLMPRDGTFASSDPLLNWTWETSRQSMQAVLEDCILADSWRERALYICDHHVQACSYAAFCRDLSPVKRGLRLWAENSDARGVSGCVPAWGMGGGIAASLYWVQLLHLIWSRDGDLADAARYFELMERCLSGEGMTSTVDGLWDVGGYLFIDWGMVQGDQSGQANGVLNAWRHLALRCGADLARALGRDEAARRWGAQADAVAAAYRRHLWIPEQRRFARRLIDGRPDAEGYAVHANALVLCAGLAGPDQVAGTLDWVERRLDVNVPLVMARDPGGSLEIFFLHWGIEALYRHGRALAAEDCLRAHYAVMQSHQATTIWECLATGVTKMQNQCQGWGTTAVRWCHDYVLGVRGEAEGDPARLVVAPDTRLEWAEGTVPHPRGLVRVAWRRVGDRLEIEAQAPDGVTLRIAPGPAFAGLRVVRRGGLLSPVPAGTVAAPPPAATAR
jgi:hypothetical protein